MNKKTKRVLFSILICLAIVSLFIAFNSNNVKANSLNKNVDYSVKSAYDLSDDEWVYVFKIYYPNSNEEKSYVFNAYNMKHSELDDHRIRVIDGDTQEVLDEIIPEYVSLLNSKKYKAEVLNINEFFNKKQFDSIISIDSISELNVTVVDKEYLVNLFNKAISSSKENVDGKYIETSNMGIVSQKIEEDGFTGAIQGAYLLKNGYIYEVRFDFIDTNGIYLSDKNNLSLKEKELLDELNNIKEAIINEQSFTGLKNEKANDIINNKVYINQLLKAMQKKIK